MFGNRHLNRCSGTGKSTARQYALDERALELGWSEHRVRFIDADLGQRAGEDALGTREGFGSLCQLLAYAPSRDDASLVLGVLCWAQHKIRCPDLGGESSSPI